MKSETMNRVTPLRPVPSPSEKEFAIRLAHNVLDRACGDPDDDLAVLARQFLRAIGEI